MKIKLLPNSTSIFKPHLLFHTSLLVKQLVEGMVQFL